MSDPTGSRPPPPREDAPPRTFVFGEFEFDERRWELRAGGVPVAVPPKVMETLALLIRHRDRLVSNEELRQALWPDVAVTEASLLKAIRVARQILGDDGDAQRFIRTTRSRGYRFVASVEERDEPPPRASRPPSAAPAPLGRGDGSTFDLDEPFVGRDAELAQLERGLERALAGRGAAFLVSGEAGIGKTRMLQIFGARAESRGARVAWGRSFEEGGAPELWPWIQVLRGLGAADSVAADPLLGHLLGDRGEEARHEVTDAAGPLFRTEAMRFRFFDAVLGLLRRLAADRALVLLLEDLQTADAASLMLMRFLSRELEETPVLLIGTYRPGDVHSAPAGPESFAKLVRDATVIGLGGLPEEDTRRLIDAALPRLADPSFVARVHRATEGNPLFVSEVLRRITSSGAPADASLERIEIPERVVEVIRGRLDALPAETRDLLSVAAVVGRGFDLGILERVADLPRREVGRRLEPALARNVIVREPATSGGYRFTHTLVRDVFYDALGGAERAQLHHKIGEVLEGLASPGTGISSAQLAHHFARAALVAGSEKVVQYTLAAGEQALRSFAFEEAARHFEAALEALRFESGREAVRVDAMTLLGHARRLAGRYPSASSAFSEGLDLARRLDDPVRLARAALGYAQVHPDSRRIDPTLIALLEESVRALETAPPGRADVAELLTLSLSRLSTCTSLFGRSEDAERLSRRALEIAQSLGDPFTRARALESRHWLLWRAGKAEERLAIAEETVELARIAKDSGLLGDARVCELTDLLELGRIDAFDRALLHYERTARPQRDTDGLYKVRMFDTTRALIEGRFDDAERVGREAFTLGLRLFERNARTSYNTIVWWMRLEQGRAQEVEAAFRAHAETEPASAPLQSGLLRTYVEGGAEEPARLLLDTLARDDFAILKDDWAFLPAAAHIAAACEFLGDAPRAALVHARLVPHIGHHVILGPGTLYLGPVSLYVGLSALAARDLDTAVLHLERALDECRDTRAHAALVRVQYHLAQALTLRGSPGDLKRARAAANEALSRSRELGMAGVERRILALDKGAG